MPRVPGREGSVLFSVFCFLGVWGGEELAFFACAREKYDDLIDLGKVGAIV